MEYLSVPEYARLTGRTRQYILKLIKEGRMTAFKAEQTGRGGNAGNSYKIPVDSLDPKTYSKYIREQKKKNGIQTPKPERIRELPTLEGMSEEERREVSFWKNVISDWLAFRSQSGKKEDLDKQFYEEMQERYPEMKLSVQIIKRKEKALRDYGEAALIDGRGKHGHHKKVMPDEVFDIFISFYLDQNRPSVEQCIGYTETWFRHEGREDVLPLPSAETFRREVLRRILPAELTYCRKGEKACVDTMLPSLKRNYDDLYSNSIWVCDNHTFDVFVNDGEHEKPVRVYLTAFQDVRSRKFVGWEVTMNPCSQATLVALRRGIEENGLPDMILSDNGREFLTHDIGGRGFRKGGKASKEEKEIPTILDNLGIRFTTAMVRNARAKIIERAFLEVKNNFSKMFDGYTGGTIAERPERLKKTGKDAENFMLLPEFIQYVDNYIRYIYNKRRHNGVGMNGRTPDQMYAECMIEKRIATPEQLNLMMMRHSRMQTVSKDGVYLNLYGQKLYFQSEDLILRHIKEKVYIRYNPDDMEEVRIYSSEDRFLCTAQQVRLYSYFEDKETLRNAISDQRKYLKAVKLVEERKQKKVMSAWELMVYAAEQNKLIDDTPDPKNYRIHALDDQEIEQLPKASGESGAEIYDLSKVVENLKRAKEG